jgi:hypothetical protein
MDAVRDAKGKFAKGHKTQARRIKGTPNKINRGVKEAMLLSAMKVGGKDGMVGVFEQIAKEDIVAFGNMLTKLLPTEIKAELEGTLRHIVTTVNIMPIQRGDVFGPDGNLYTRETFDQLFPKPQPPEVIEHAPQPVEPLRSGPPKLVVDNDVEERMREALSVNAELLARARKSGLIE